MVLRTQDNYGYNRFMYYVYVIKSMIDKELYVGSTSDLKKRFNAHNQGKVKSTKSRIPFSLCFYEAYPSKTISLVREKYLKTSDGHKDIYKRLAIN